MDLFVRAGRNDNLVIDELVAPATSGLRLARHVPMQALVIDAPTAAASNSLRQSANLAGLPLLVDPLTHLFQDHQAPDHSWAALSFAHHEPARPTDFAVGSVLDELIERVVSFQLEHGASAVIPPYFHAKSPDDPWFGVQMTTLQRTAAYLQAEGINLPVMPVFAGALQQFGPQAKWEPGLDRFLRRITRLNVRYVAVALSASRSQRGDTSARLATYLTATRHLADLVPTIAWRQGQYGLAAAAVGAAGYQTGAGTDERCDLPSHSRARRPSDDKEPPRMQKRIYLREFGRSISGKAAEALLAHGYLRGALVCNDPMTCCPDGATSMSTNWRQHALRTRARELEELGAMPDTAWRLNHVARQAERAAIDAKAANEILEGAGVAERVPEESFRSLGEVADALRATAKRAS